MDFLIPLGWTALVIIVPLAILFASAFVIVAGIIAARKLLSKRKKS